MATFSKQGIRSKHRGAVLVLSMIFIVLFSALAVAMASLSETNVQVASNQHKVGTALHAAQSGLECAKYLVKTVSLAATSTNTVTDSQANTVWTNLCSHATTKKLGNRTPSVTAITDGSRLTIANLSFGTGCGSCTLNLYRYNADPRTIHVQSIGTCGDVSRPVTRSVRMDLSITKANDVLNYAVATRGRMWLTGDTTINGDVFSAWNVASISPFNMTSDSTVLGTINTVLTKSQISHQSYQMETLDSNGQPMFTFGTTVYDATGHLVTGTRGTVDNDGYMVDLAGNPVYDEDGCRVAVDYANRVYSGSDEIQAYHRNINYGQTASAAMPGMSISDYNTSVYKNAIGSSNATIASGGALVSNGVIPNTASSGTVTEYFPHASNSYSTPSNSSSLKLTRYKYANKTFSNVTLSMGKNALFSNCTFEGVLYIDCSTTSTSTGYTNNVRFDNCTFNGTIITNTPTPFSWQRNALYFTGPATFDNQSSVQEATILAPHFNVNLGNTNSERNDNNVLTGAIVGGIVDVRGNAQIYGTIISMADTTMYTSGYVSNIGATLDDGGSETTTVDDIGVITITPEEDMMLPSGITTPIVINPNPKTYSETI
jgi:Tfp pilus assembly protein PilX